MKCQICGEKIPSARLEILPGTTVCVKCSVVKPYSEEDVDIAEPNLGDGEKHE